MIGPVCFTGRERLLGTRSAAKAWRKSEERRGRNRSRRSTAKTHIHTAEATIVAEPLASAEAVRLAISSLDRAAQRGALHPNNADRRKARLMHKHNVAIAAAEAAAAAAAAAAATKAEAKPARGRKAKEEKVEKAPAKAERGKKPKK
jgi:small subunit ribosomal protein S20